MQRRLELVCWASVLALAFGVTLGLPAGLRADEKKADAKTPAQKTTYAEHVKPILRAKCFACHNPDKKSGDLDMTNYTNLMEGGGSGEVIEPGSSTDSYLFDLISHDAEPFMPPKQDKLSAEMLAVIAAWINGGALENRGSKVTASNQPKFNFELKSAPSGKPAGPPPMPERLSLEPVVHTRLTTAISSLATSPWAPLVALGGQKQVLLYQAQTLDLLGVLPFPEGVPYVLKFSRNGSLLLAGGGRGSYLGKVVVWDVKTGERVIEAGDELDAVLGADINADQTLIALGGPQRVVRVYSTGDGKLLYDLRKHTDWVTSVEFSPDGVLLATGDRNGGVYVWEAHTGREYLALAGHRGLISGLSWRSDSNILASASEDGTIKLWEMENGRQVKNWGAHGGGAASVEFTRDGRLVSCGRDRLTKLWDQNGKQLRAFEAFADLALEVTFCDETGRVIAGDWTGAIRVWDANDGKRLGELSPNPALLADRLSAAEKTLAARRAEHHKLAGAAQSAQSALNKVNADLTAANQAVNTLQQQTQNQDTVTALKTAQSRVTTLTAAVKLATEKAAAAKKASDTAAAVLRQTEQEVAHWKAAIGFEQKRKELAAKQPD